MLYSLNHYPTCRFEVRQALIYQLVSGLTDENGKYNYAKAVHHYPPFFDISCSAKNYKIASALTVEQLSESLEISLPADLCDFYRDGHKVTPDTPFLSAAGCTYLISSVYPLAYSNSTTETLQAVVEDERQRVGGPLLFAQNGAIPIADDPFGNIYFLPPDEETVYVYDHEFDMAFSTHIPLKDFMDNLYSKEA